jgi:hypothetical protein
MRRLVRNKDETCHVGVKLLCVSVCVCQCVCVSACVHVCVCLCRVCVFVCVGCVELYFLCALQTFSVTKLHF